MNSPCTRAIPGYTRELCLYEIEYTLSESVSRLYESDLQLYERALFEREYTLSESVFRLYESDPRLYERALPIREKIHPIRECFPTIRVLRDILQQFIGIVWTNCLSKTSKRLNSRIQPLLFCARMRAIFSLIP